MHRFAGYHRQIGLFALFQALFQAFASPPVCADSLRACSALLQSGDRAGSATPEAAVPEAAVTDAWRSMLEDAFLLSAHPASLLSCLEDPAAIASTLGYIHRSGELPIGAEAREGLDRLSLIVDQLIEQGRIDPLGLGERLREEATALVARMREVDSTEEDGRRRRSRMTDPIQRFQLGGRIAHSPQALSDGRIMVVVEGELVFLNREGAVLSRTQVASAVSTPPVALPGGGFVFATPEGMVLWVDDRGRETARAQSAVRHANRLVVLQDGRVVVSAIDSPSVLVSRKGRSRILVSGEKKASVQFQLPDGRILFASDGGKLIFVHADPGRPRLEVAVTPNADRLEVMRLRNGNLFVKSSYSGFHLLDANGARLHDVHVGHPGVGSPAELADGGVILGGAGDGIFIMNADGTLRAKVPVKGEIHSDAGVLSNGVAVVGGGEDPRLRFISAEGEELGSIGIGPWSSIYDGIRGGMLEVHDASDGVFGFVGLLNGELIRVDLTALAESFGFPRPFERVPF